jgi:hypothetical protein
VGTVSTNINSKRTQDKIVSVRTTTRVEHWEKECHKENGSYILEATGWALIILYGETNYRNIS